MYTRQSAGCSRSGSLLKDCLNGSMDQLSRVAESVMKHNSSFESDSLDMLKERIFNLSHEIALVEDKNECTVQVVDEFLNGEVRVSGNSTLDDENNKLLLQNKIHNKHGLFIVESNPKVKRIKKILHSTDFTSASDDDDCELILTSFSIYDSKCPYSLMTFDHPMRRYINVMFLLHDIFKYFSSANCIHHLSRASLEDMFKINKNRCPVIGCDGVWQRHTSTFDNVFDSSVKNFVFRNKLSEGEKKENVDTRIYTIL
jgi:hypothetical protein